MSEKSCPLAQLLRNHQDKYPRLLAERFPRIAERIARHWFDPAASEAYFGELLISDRAGRQGFPEEIAREIMVLSLAYESIRQLQEKERTDVWEMERAQKELEQSGLRATIANFARGVEAGDHALCRLYITAGLDINGRDSRHWTPLMMTAFNGEESLVRELLKYGADINAADHDGYTAMHWASYNGHAPVVALLADRGVDVNITSRAGITPLLQAASRGKLETCLELLGRGANPNIVAVDGCTALLKAVANAHLPIIDLLLARNARLDVRMTNGTSLLEIAAASRDAAVSERIAAAASRKAEGLAGAEGESGGAISRYRSG